jgi:hypothetical protein
VGREAKKTPAAMNGFAQGGFAPYTPQLEVQTFAIFIADSASIAFCTHRHRPPWSWSASLSTRRALFGCCILDDELANAITNRAEL